MLAPVTSAAAPDGVVLGPPPPPPPPLLPPPPPRPDASPGVAAAAPGPAAAAPTGGTASAGTGRMVGLDVARAVALLGMVTVHITFDSTGWWTTVASGRASVLFITLAGVVVSMLHRRGSASAAPTYLLRRAAVLILVGEIMSYTFWGTTILHYYGVLFLVAPYLLRRSTRALALMAAAALAVGPVVLVLLEPNLAWVDTLPPVSNWVLTELSWWLVWLYPLTVWIGFFLVGIIVGRTDLARLRNALVLLVTGVALAVSVTFVSDALPWHPGSGLEDEAWEAPDTMVTGTLTTDDGSELDVQRAPDGTWREFTEPDEAEEAEDEAAAQIDWGSLNDLSAHSNRTPWALQSLGIALAVIGLFLALPRPVLRLFRPLAAVGSMTLSAYIVHSFFVQDVWEWTGAADHPERQVPMLLAIFAVLILGAMAIRARCSQGPFEWLLKWISGRQTHPRSG